MWVLRLLTPQPALPNQVKRTLDSGSGLFPQKITVPRLSRPTLSAELELMLSSLLNARFGIVQTQTAVNVNLAQPERLLHRVL